MVCGRELYPPHSVMYKRGREYRVLSVAPINDYANFMGQDNAFVEVFMLNI